MISESSMLTNSSPQGIWRVILFTSCFYYVLLHNTGLDPSFKMEERRASDIFCLSCFCQSLSSSHRCNLFFSRSDMNIGELLAASIMHQITSRWTVWISCGPFKRITKLVALTGVSYMYTTTGNPKPIPYLNFLLPFECMNRHGIFSLNTPINSCIRCTRVYAPPTTVSTPTFCQEMHTLSNH